MNETTVRASTSSDILYKEPEDRKATKRSRTISTESQQSVNSDKFPSASKAVKINNSEESKNDSHSALPQASTNHRQELDSANTPSFGVDDWFEGEESQSSSSQGLDTTDSGFEYTEGECKIASVQRNWLSTLYGRDHSKKVNSNPYQHHKKMEFTIASYNVLAQKLIDENPYLYTNCPYEHLDWEYRSENILSEFKEHQPDILCLQEVQSDHYASFFRPELGKLGYEGVYKQRTGRRPDGCATFYKTDLFKLVRSTKLEYYRRGTTVLDKDNVAVLVLLSPNKKQGGKDCSQHSNLCIANTHLLFNPRRGDIKLAQLQLLFAEIDALTNYNSSKRPWKSVYHPVIFCGDLNSEPYSSLYEFVLCRNLKYEGLTANRVSGQKEGFSARRGHAMNKLLVPEWIGITDQCQKVEEFDLRYNAYVATKNRKSSSYQGGLVDNQTVNGEASRSDWSQDKVWVEDMDISNDGLNSCGKDKTTEKNDGLNSCAKIEESNVVSSDNPKDGIITEGLNTQTVTSGIVDQSTHSGKSGFNSNYMNDLNPQGEDFSRELDFEKSSSYHRNRSHSSGVLSHNFEFVSVYDHFRKLGKKKWKREVTTSHSRANCTVDYIFYTVDGKDTEWRRDRRGERLVVENVRESKLKLLGRYALLLDDEFEKQGGLPNGVLGSDHILLMAKFLWNLK